MDLIVVETTTHENRFNHVNYEQVGVVYNGSDCFSIKQTPLCNQLIRGSSKINLFGSLKLQTLTGAVINEFESKYSNNVVNTCIDVDKSKSVTFYKDADDIIFMEVINYLEQKYIYILKSGFDKMSVLCSNRLRHYHDITEMEWEMSKDRDPWHVTEREMEPWISGRAITRSPNVLIVNPEDVCPWSYDNDRYTFEVGVRYNLKPYVYNSMCSIHEIHGEFYQFFD